jgi:hypothetical protein
MSILSTPPRNGWSMPLNEAVANDAVVKPVNYCTSRKCHQMMNILIVEVSQNVAVIVHLFPYVLKYGNVFIMIFNLVSNISVEEYARLVPLFVLLLLWIITAYRETS